MGELVQNRVIDAPPDTQIELGCLEVHQSTKVESLRAVLLRLRVNREPTIFHPSNRPVPGNNRSTTDPIANSTSQSSDAALSNSTAQPSKKRGRPSNPDPSWFEERDGGFSVLFLH